MRKIMAVAALLALIGCTQADDLRACAATCTLGVKEFLPATKEGRLVCKCYTVQEFCQRESK